MDRLEKRAEDIMRRGDLIIAERKRKSALIRRTAYAVSGLCAVALIGTGIWHNRDLFSAPDRKAHDDFSVITETTETTAEKSVCETTSFSITTTKADTTAKVKTTTQTETQKSTSIFTAINTVQSSKIIENRTTVSVSAVHSSTTVTQTDTMTETNSTTINSSIYVSNTKPLTETCSTNITSDITTTTSCSPHINQTASIPLDKVSDIVERGKEIEYNEITYTSNSIVFTIGIIDNKIGEYNEIPIYSIKGYSSKTAITLGINDKYYVFINKNYSVSNLKEFITDTAWDSCEDFSVFYGMTETNGMKEKNAVKEILFSVAENSELSESKPSVYGKIASIYNNSPYTLAVYESGYLCTQVNEQTLYFYIGEEKAKSFFEIINQT